jgi:MFS family permease
MSTHAHSSSLSRPHRFGPTVAVLAFAGMGGSFMQTILIPIQGELPRLLDASREDTAWVITVTLLVSAICTPITGRLGDMFGKRRIALICAALLVIGSIVAALSPTVVPLIVARALQGTGTGVIPLGISILRDVVPKERLGSSIALVSSTLGVGGALGLPISALVTDLFDWHVLFWVAAAIGTVTFLLILWVVPVSVLRTGGRFDYAGAVGLSIGLTGVLLAISRGNEWGWLSAPTLSFLAAGIVALAIWSMIELRQSSPLVDLRVSTRGPVLLTNLASIAMGFALFASSIAFPQLLQLPTEADGVGLELLPASLVLMPSGLAMLAMSPIAGRISHIFGPKPLLITGAAVIALSYLAAALLPSSLIVILLVNIFVGVGIGLGYAAMPTLIMQAVPANETGAANGLNTLMRGLGTSVAAAAVGAVLAQSSGASGLPNVAAFQTAILMGLVAAVLCTVLAAFIPRPRATAGEHPSLPEGRL